MSGISIKAVLLATLAVFGIDFVSGMVLTSIFSGPMTNATEEQMRAAADALLQDQGYLVGALILGTASTIVGGYLTARLADSVPYFNALAFGALGILLGVLLSPELPTWFKVVGFGLNIPAALAGAYLCKRRASVGR